MFVRVLPAMATALALAAPLHAQDDGPSSGADQNAAPQMGAITAEMIEDASIVSLQGQYDEDIWNDGAPLNAMIADLTEIGEVEDIVLTPDGQMEGLTTDVGGFLGIGEKQVLIRLDDLRLTRAPDSDDITIITRMSEDDLQNAPEYTLEGAAGD